MRNESLTGIEYVEAVIADIERQGSFERAFGKIKHYEQEGNHAAESSGRQDR